VNFFDVKTMSVIERLFVLRSVAIVVQLATVLAVYFVMSLHIALYPLLVVIALETLFHGVSILIFRQRQAGHLAIFGQVLADVLFLTLLMSLSGGATNAFVSLLLMPIVIAAVSLPATLLSIISLCAVVAYSVLLLSMPEQSMHQMEMSNHFIGMWANFLLSVIVVTFVVGAMARLISERERAIALQREEQLRSEQLLALGVASAQVTHQLATPLTHLQLLFDELIEDYPQVNAVVEMRQPLKDCANQLGYFRTLATSIRENDKEIITVMSLINQIRESVTLQFPSVSIDFAYAKQLEPSLHAAQIESDAMLLPAILNLVQNGIKSNNKVGETQLIVGVGFKDKHLKLAIRDFGVGLHQHQELLGERLVKSDSGLGMAMLLSNSTFERLGGHLKLVNHEQQGAIAHVTLPIFTDTRS